MIRKIEHSSRSWAGVARPDAGVLRLALMSVGVALASSLFAAGCGSQDRDRNLQPSEVGLTKGVAPIFDDGETKLFEVKRGLQFPVLAPSQKEQNALDQDDVEPYGRAPWITADDVKVQLTWTLSNLDDDGHTVEILVDPWNEFGRYYPGMQLADAEEQKFEPNLSGIDQYFVLDGKGAGDSSRRHGTFTFDDMKEMAVDFATVQNLIKNPPATLPNGFASKDDGMDDPLPVYANHAFNLQNHSYDDVLSAPYIPAVIAGLTGIDFGFRTSEAVGSIDPVTGADVGGVALEISIEIADTGNDRVQPEGSNEALLKPTTAVVTVGSPVPAAPAAM